MSGLIKNIEISNARNLSVQQVGPTDVEEASTEKTAVDLKEIFAAELEQLEKECREKGYQDGEAQAAADAEKDLSKKKQKLEESYAAKEKALEEQTNQLSDLLDSIKESKHTELMALESHIVTLTLESLYKLLGDKANYRKYVRALVSESLKSFSHESGIQLCLSPYDASLLESSGYSMDDRDDIRLVTDSALEPGQCLVEAGSSVLDTSIVSRLDKLRDTLVNTYRQRKDIDA